VSLASAVDNSKLTAGGEAVSMKDKGSALATASPEAQSNPDSQIVGALMVARRTKVTPAEDAGSVWLLDAPPASGLNVIVKLTGFAVGPCTRAKSPVEPGAKTLRSGTR
tara:strand:+ start:575 stop:901 length:327 start_codon:yes stop_codon:yes gene_type:complete